LAGDTQLARPPAATVPFRLLGGDVERGNIADPGLMIEEALSRGGI